MQGGRYCVPGSRMPPAEQASAPAASICAVSSSPMPLDGTCPLLSQIALLGMRSRGMVLPEHHAASGGADKISDTWEFCLYALLNPHQ